MDPYLEQERMWRGFRSGLAATITAVLNRGLPETFAANLGGRASVEAPYERYELFIDVIAVKDRHDVTCRIELLSPLAKVVGSAERTQYLTERWAVLVRERVSLLEVDLFRSGMRVTATPGQEADYLICLHRCGSLGTEYEYWPVRLRERLPCILVPLMGGLPDVSLDLQAAFDAAYDAGPYRRLVDYGVDPVPPVVSEDAAWADVLLREKGLRV
jgi:hypothetical protein